MTTIKQKKIKPPKNNKFLQGYACCLAMLISGHGCDTQHEEAFTWEFGKYNESQLLIIGIDQHDIDIFKSNNLLKS